MEASLEVTTEVTTLVAPTMCFTEIVSKDTLFHVNFSLDQDLSKSSCQIKAEVFDRDGDIIQKDKNYRTESVKAFTAAKNGPVKFCVSAQGKNCYVKTALETGKTETSEKKSLDRAQLSEFQKKVSEIYDQLDSFETNLDVAQNADTMTQESLTYTVTLITWLAVINSLIVAIAGYVQLRSMKGVFQKLKLT